MLVICVGDTVLISKGGSVIRSENLVHFVEMAQIHCKGLIVFPLELQNDTEIVQAVASCNMVLAVCALVDR